MDQIVGEDMFPSILGWKCSFHIKSYSFHSYRVTVSWQTMTSSGLASMTLKCKWTSSGLTTLLSPLPYGIRLNPTTSETHWRTACPCGDLWVTSWPQLCWSQTKGLCSFPFVYTNVTAVFSLSLSLFVFLLLSAGRSLGWQPL